ncbi:MAG: right-handed parallel beta-helix repeat-containing protein [Owenweeksia sp.]
MKNLLLIGIALGIFALASCRKDNIIKNDGVQLKFSADTVFLDTVFNTVGSSTYLLKVFNPDQQKVIIDNIRLENPASCYRLNVNGKAGNNINNVEVLPEDSIYIFIEITPGSCSSPEMVYEDLLLFENKGTEQFVTLTTLVWDASFHYPDKFLISGEGENSFVIPYSIINCNTTWRRGERHVVYGYAVIDEGCELTIEPGVEVYFHQNSGLWVFNGATLKVAEGASPGIGDSVLFTGDRLEPSYEDIPGQWGGLLGGIFIDDSARVILNNSVIKNSENAIRLDSAQFTDQLTISNSYILNTSRTGIFGGFGSVTAENLVIANSGYYGLFCYGGNYEFRHCTFANYWTQSTRTVPTVFLTNYFDFRDAAGSSFRVVRPLQKAYFGNCIIYGNNRQELSIEKDDADILEFEFNHALLKLDRDEDDRGFDVTGAGFTSVIVNLDPRFIEVEENNYDLDTTSQAIDQGNNQDALRVNLDIKGRIRNIDGDPDLGAFEFQK